MRVTDSILNKYSTLSKLESNVIKNALGIIQRQLEERNGSEMRDPQMVKDFLVLTMGLETTESFGVMYLNARNQVIAYVTHFAGTTTQANVYPREIVKAAIHHNAMGVILSHNHPSGTCQQSRADEHLTQVLKQALTLVDVLVLDHIIVAGTKTFSFAENGLI